MNEPFEHHKKQFTITCYRTREVKRKSDDLKGMVVSYKIVSYKLVCVKKR